MPEHTTTKTWPLFLQYPYCYRRYKKGITNTEVEDLLKKKKTTNNSSTLEMQP